MASFFEKLKKGMGVDVEIKEASLDESAPVATPVMEVAIENEAEAPVVKKIRKKRQAKVAILAEEPPEEPAEPPQELKIEPEPVKEIEIEGMEKPSFAKTAEEKEDWFEEPAGQLAIDVFQTEQDLIIQTAIAGIKPGDLEVTVERDIIAIKGIRQRPSKDNGDYFTKECYWGPFVREVIAPVEINPDMVEAVMQEGVLTVRLPKILRDRKRMITVKA